MIVKITITAYEIEQAIRLWIESQRPILAVPEGGDIFIDAVGINLLATYEVEIE